MSGVLLAAALAAASAGPPDPLARWSEPIGEASARFGIPAEWIRRVMRVESGGRTSIGGRLTVSRAGAMGLMQLMPATWAAMRATHGLGQDPHQPRDNILAGTAYLRAMYDRFGYPGLFAAYNAGPARYAEHLARGRPLPAETRAYMSKVAGRATWNPRPYPLPNRVAQTGMLFVVAPRSGLLESLPQPQAAVATQPGSPALFVRLNEAGRR